MLAFGFFVTLLDLTADQRRDPEHAPVAGEVLPVIDIHLPVPAALLIVFGRMRDVRGPC